MTYAVLGDLIKRAGDAEILQIADRDDDQIADPDVILAALESADEKINAWLGARFSLPLSTTPPIVVLWAVSIARYFLHRDGAPDHVVRDYKDALADLQAAASGKLSLPGLDGVQPGTPSQVGISSGGPEPVFNRDNLEGFL